MCRIILLCLMASVVQAAAGGLKIARGRQAWETRTQLPQNNQRPETKLKRQLTEEDEDDDVWEERSEQSSAGVDLISNVCETITDPSWETAGTLLSSIGGLAAVTVPQPAGLIAGGVLGLVGGLMGIFGGDSGPSNQDILDSMNDNFEKVFQVMDAGFQKVINSIGVKIDHLEEQIQTVQAKLEELMELTEKIYSSTVLQGGRIKTFIQKMATLNARLVDAGDDPVVMPLYISYLHQMADDFDDMQGSVGALGARNFEAMLTVMSGWSSTAQDYAVVVEAVTLYSWFYQARASLFSVLMQSSILKFGNLTSRALRYTKNFVQDVTEYDEVLKRFKIDQVFSFGSSRLAACSATANSVMVDQGLSVVDFMNPYVYVNNGDCSGMLADVSEAECDASLFWNGRSSTVNLNSDDLYVDEITQDTSATAHEVKVEWLGSCSTSLDSSPCSEVVSHFGLSSRWTAGDGLPAWIYMKACSTCDPIAVGIQYGSDRSRDLFAALLMLQPGQSGACSEADANDPFWGLCSGAHRFQTDIPGTSVQGAYHQFTVTLRTSGVHSVRIQSPDKEEYPFSYDFNLAGLLPSQDSPQICVSLEMDGPCMASEQQYNVQRLLEPGTNYWGQIEHQIDAQLYQEPLCPSVCGCRISADSRGYFPTFRSHRVCSNRCYGSPTTTTTTTTVTTTSTTTSTTNITSTATTTNTTTTTTSTRGWKLMYESKFCPNGLLTDVMASETLTACQSSCVRAGKPFLFWSTESSSGAPSSPFCACYDTCDNPGEWIPGSIYSNQDFLV